MARFHFDPRHRADTEDLQVTVHGGVHDIPLISEAFITVVDPDGTSEVKAGETIYPIYRSGDGLQVYAVPA